MAQTNPEVNYAVQTLQLCIYLSHTFYISRSEFDFENTIFNLDFLIGTFRFSYDNVVRWFARLSQSLINLVSGSAIGHQSRPWTNVDLLGISISRCSWSTVDGSHPQHYLWSKTENLLNCHFVTYSLVENKATFRGRSCIDMYMTDWLIDNVSHITRQAICDTLLWWPLGKVANPKGRHCMPLASIFY